MTDKKNIANKVRILFIDKSTWQDIKHISGTKIVEEQMAKQWDSVEMQSADLKQKQRIWAKVINAIDSPKASRLNIRHMLRNIAAAIVIFIVFAVGYKLNFQEKNTIQTLLEVHTGSFMEYALPDSSKVWMQPGSFIRFDKEFDKGRDIWTDGKMIFEVTKNEKSPFTVHLSKATIKVLGTSFSVLEMDNDKSKIEVILHSGLVEFTNEISGEKTSLKPHEKLVFNSESGDLKIEKYSTINWEDGRYTFDNVEVGNLIATLNDLYKTTILLDEKVNSSHRMTGSIKFDEPLDDVIHKICYSLHTYHVKKDSQIIIK